MKLERKDLLLALVFFAVRVEGRTQLQKLTFLAQEEAKLKAGYHFESWKFGPFSSDIWRDMDALIDEGAAIEIPQGTKEEVLGYMYILSKQGRDYVTSDILPKLDGETLNLLKTIILRYSQMTLTELLTYVYDRYPEYTDKSEWRGSNV